MELEGVASLAVLPSGSVSGHFVHPPTSTCLAIFGTEIECERECSRGEDHRLLNLTIHDFATKREARVIVEWRGEDAARFSNVEDVHGWQEDVIEAAERRKRVENRLHVAFECEILKSGEESEDHLRRFLPSLVGMGAVVNIGTMTIKGLDFDRKIEEVIPEEGPHHLGSRRSSVEHSTSVISGAEHLERLSICSETCSTTSKPSSCVNTPRSFLSGEPRALTPDDELYMLVKEELAAEGLPYDPLEYLWEEDAFGWRIKCHAGKRASVAVDSSSRSMMITEGSL